MKRLFIVLILLLPLFATAQKRQNISIDSFTALKQGRDTLHFINIFHRYNWDIDAHNNKGSFLRFSTSRPDTINLKEISEITMSTLIAVDPSLTGRDFIINYNLTGSVILKLNSEAILATGSFAGDDNSKLKGLDQYEFVNFRFNDTTEKIEVTYRPHPIAKAFDMSLLLSPVDRGFNAYHKIFFTNVDIRLFSLGFYYLAFGIVFFVLFFFFKEKNENLYFSLFCLFMSVAFITGTFSGLYAEAVSTLSAVIALEFTCLFLAKALREKERTKIPLITICCIAAIVLCPSVLYNYISFFNKRPQSAGIFITNKLFIFYELWLLFYLVVSGFRRKNPQAKPIFIFGLISTVLYLFLPIVSYFVPGLRNLSGESYINYISSLALCFIPLGAVLVLGKKNGENQKQLLEKELEKKRILENQKESLEKEVALRTSEVVQQRDEIEKQHGELKIEKKKSDDLLLNILPEEVAEELKETGRSKAKFFNDVSVLFTDFVDFTKAGETMSPQELVDELHICFKAFDEIISRHHIEKIKTIGDAYLAVGGLPVPDPQHAVNVATAATEITQFIAERKQQHNKNVFDIRIGIHSGSAVAGIVGVKKFAYDIWGDTVNTAARMEQHSEPGKINISQTTFDLVKDKFECTYRGEIKAKNKGELSMYFIEKVKSERINQ